MSVNINPFFNRVARVTKSAGQREAVQIESDAFGLDLLDASESIDGKLTSVSCARNLRGVISPEGRQVRYFRILIRIGSLSSKLACEV